MSDDTPNQRLETSAAEGELVEERKKSRALLFTLIGVGAALLIAIIVLLIILFGGGGGGGGSTPSPTASESSSPTPSESPTPSATPTPTPTPTPVPTVTVTAAPQSPPDDGNVHITSYSVSPKTCTPNQQVTLHFTWKSTNGNIAYFGVNTTDAQGAGMGWGLPATGTSDADFPDGYRPFTYYCESGTISYTITVVGNGSKASQTVTVKGQ